jgi:hypothetical protein
MYRYYLVKDQHMPKGDENYGYWNAIHLDSHGNAGKGWNVLILHDVHVPPHPEWKAFPKIVDAKTPLKAKVPHQVLADIGLTGDETTLEASDRLGEIVLPFSHP